MDAINQPVSSLRPLSLTLGVLNRADGSARFSFAAGLDGACECMASVNGPIEVRQRDERLDAATVEVGVIPLRGLPGPPSRSLQFAISTILSPLLDLHSHPRSLIQLVVQSLATPTARFSKPFRAFSAEGETADSVAEEDKRAVELACALNACTCALIDLGGSIGMHGLAFAVAVAILAPEVEGGEPRIVLDPPISTERDAAMTLVIGFSFGHGEEAGGEEGEMVWCETCSTAPEGPGVSMATLEAAIAIARTACQAIHAFVRKSVEGKLLRDSSAGDASAP